MQNTQKKQNRNKEIKYTETSVSFLESILTLMAIPNRIALRSPSSISAKAALYRQLDRNNPPQTRVQKLDIYTAAAPICLPRLLNSSSINANHPTIRLKTRITIRAGNKRLALRV